MSSQRSPSFPRRATRSSHIGSWAVRPVFLGLWCSVASRDLQNRGEYCCSFSTRQALTICQAQYYGMETGYGLSASNERCGLELRVREIQILSRIQAPQPTYEIVGIQVHILHGMGTSAVGPGRWPVLCSTRDLLHCTKKSIGEDGF